MCVPTINVTEMCNDHYASFSAVYTVLQNSKKHRTSFLIPTAINNRKVQVGVIIVTNTREISMYIEPQMFPHN